MKKIAVLLSGCGVFDGSEIHESVLTLLAIIKAGAQYQCFAPDINQADVINHLSGEPDTNQIRNVLVESARIARGEIKTTTELIIDDYDGLVIPGGFGAAKNLCDFAFTSTACQIQPLVKDFVSQFVTANKPVGFICIAPVMIPLFYGKQAIGTVGSDPETVLAFKTMGGEHKLSVVDDIVVDEINKIVSTPAYMLAENILQSQIGIEKLVNKVIELALANHA